MIAQQIKLDAARADLESAESILANQETQLNEARSLLDEKEDQISAKQQELDALSVQLGQQQTTIDDQKQTLAQAQSLIDEKEDQISAKQQELDALSVQLGQQQTTIDDQQRQLDDQQRQIEQLVGMRTRIITSLSEALRSAGINAAVDRATGAITLESDVLFETGKYDLSERGKDFIDRFLSVYLNVLFSEEYRDYVSEVIIEGHTDSEGGYIENLKLSQQRALAVASYVLEDNYSGISVSQRNQLRRVVTVNGRSFSDPVLNAYGYEDMDASRRVVFKFRLTDERMIEQLKSILEENDSAQ